MGTNETFSKGDLVTHKCNPGDMEARFVSYKPRDGVDKPKVIVEYTYGYRKGSKGEWLEKYCIPRFPLGKKLEYPDDFTELSKVTEETEFHSKSSTCADAPKEIHDRMRGSSITGRRATHVILDDLEVKPHAEIPDESFEEIHNDTAWGTYYNKLKNSHQKDKKNWFAEMYNCDFSELEKRAMANMVPKQKHDDFVDALNHAHQLLTKETPMKETITEMYVDGELAQTLIGDQDIETMSATDMLQAIGSVNNALEKLNKHDMSSTYVARRAAKLNKFVKSVYKILDEKFDK